MAKNLVSIDLDNTEYSLRPYGTCSTVASTAAKTVAIDGFTLCEGATVLVKFDNGNNVDNPSLNVNNTGAKPIVSEGDRKPFIFKNIYYEFVYDGTNWQLIGKTPSVHKYYSSLDIGENVIAAQSKNWYTIGVVADANPTIYQINAYAHSDVIFSVVKGWASGAITVLNSNPGGNASYAYIDGIRLVAKDASNAYVQVRINYPSQASYITIDVVANPTKYGTSILLDGLTIDMNEYEGSSILHSLILSGMGGMYAKTFNGNLTGNADTASDSSKLGGQLPSYYATAADYVKKSGDTMTGDLTIKRNSSDSPSIILQRAETNDTYEDWRMSNVGGYFKIQNRNSGNTWVDVLSLAPSATKTLTSSYSVLPSVNDTLTLGNSTYKWKDVYATTFNGNATSATTATHLSGGVAGSIPYQTAAGTTTMLAKGNNGQVLKISNGVPTWANEYTYTHPDSGVTANSYGPSANATPAHGETFSVPYFTVNAQGHVTAASTKTITLPADNNTDTKNTAGSTNSTSKMYLIGATSQGDNPQTYSNSNVYATNGDLVANSFQGSIKGTSANNVNTAYKDLHFQFYNNVTGCDSTVSTDGKRYAGTANSYGFPVSNNANAMLWIGAHSGNYGHQLGFSSDGRIYDRCISNGSFPTTVNGGSWKKIAYTSDIITPEIATETEIKNASWW